MVSCYMFIVLLSLSPLTYRYTVYLPEGKEAMFQGFYILHKKVKQRKMFPKISI